MLRTTLAQTVFVLLLVDGSFASTCKKYMDVSTTGAVTNTVAETTKTCATGEVCVTATGIVSITASGALGVAGQYTFIIGDCVTPGTTMCQAESNAAESTYFEPQKGTVSHFACDSCDTDNCNTVPNFPAIVTHSSDSAASASMSVAIAMLSLAAVVFSTN